MAFYAEMKRRRWYCVVGVNMITWYSNKLYEDWYNSLTDEQKQRIEEARRRRAEKNKRELEASIQRLAIMSATMLGLNYGRSNYDKYHGVYDEFGFPKL